MDPLSDVMVRSAEAFSSRRHLPVFKSDDTSWAPERLLPAATEPGMARRVETFDWARTPLGSRESWPQSLETLVGTVLQAPVPMFVWWGPQLIGLYNDACIPFLAERHPQALGCPASETWADLWPDLGHQAWDVWQERAASDAKRVFTTSNKSL
jgi:hypothetical protein